MLFFINYKKTFDHILFKLWLIHYKKLNISYRIYLNKEDLDYFNLSYKEYENLIIDYIPNNVLEITEKDFLFSYTKDDNDNMILIYDINQNFINESIIIGKVFHVPIINKNIYSTFEIPDFILYEHSDHTNYTIDGIKINGGSTISKNIVCFNMNISKVAYENEYYENHLLYMEYNKYTLGSNIYINNPMNLITNKQKKYGVIWHPKCGCSTIMNIFCKINNINIEKENERSLNYHKIKYRYNKYLQNIDIINFVRNPYIRFLSTYIDKNIYQNDNIFITLDGYLEYIKLYTNDTLYNLFIFLLNNKSISLHYNLMCGNNYIESLKYKFYKIEDGLNNILFKFLQKYHFNIDLYKDYIYNCHENSIVHKNNNITYYKIQEIHGEIVPTLDMMESESCEKLSEDYNIEKYKKFNESSNNNIKNIFMHYKKDQWLTYLNNKINYNIFLENEDYKNYVYIFFNDDFIKYNYDQ